MRRLYIHIGQTKTGSTAIQRALSSNRAVLAGFGLLYPGTKDTHHEVVSAVAPPANSEESWGDATPLVEAMRAADGDVILSSEGLHAVKPSALREWCGNADVRVIVYLREQAEAMASTYQQHVKAELESGTLEDLASSLLYDYAGFLNNWAAVFGHENLIVRAYDGDVVADFLGLFGIAPGALVLPSSDPNPSIAGALLEAKRRLNASFSGTAATMQWMTWKHLIDLANERKEYRGRVAATPDFIESIRVRHCEINEVLARTYMGRDVAFPERPWVPVPVFAESDVAAALTELRRRSPRLVQALPADA